MSALTSVPLLDVDHRPGTPPIVQVGTVADIAGWAAENRSSLLDLVANQGSVRIRGLKLRNADDVAAVFRRIAPKLMTEREAFAARRTYAEGIYSSATWPANQPMCMHHELSYATRFPGLMLFACLSAPSKGGATGTADATAVLEALPAELVGRFEREGWLLTRNYTDEIGVSPADAFGTGDRAAIETYCRTNAIEFEWQADGGLRTRQRRSAIVHHPVTDQRCWFNQIAFLNEWTIDPEIREFLVDMYGPEGLPFNTSFGNGDSVTPDIVQAINEVYEANTVREPWTAGDILLVDNVRSAHSREAYEGPREIIVAMADAQTRTSEMAATVEEV
jgi:alpha-ketoglutarate-dependent taurine dioxygenase